MGCFNSKNAEPAAAQPAATLAPAPVSVNQVATPVAAPVASVSPPSAAAAPPVPAPTTVGDVVPSPPKSANQPENSILVRTGSYSAAVAGEITAIATVDAHNAIAAGMAAAMAAAAATAAAPDTETAEPELEIDAAMPLPQMPAHEETAVEGKAGATAAGAAAPRLVQGARDLAAPSAPETPAGKPEVSPFKDKLNMFKQASQERLKTLPLLPLPDRVMAPHKDAAGKTIPGWKLVVQQEHLDKVWEKKKKAVEQQNKILVLPAWKRAKMERNGSLPKLEHPLDTRKSASKKASKSARSSKTSSPDARPPRPATAPTAVPGPKKEKELTLEAVVNAIEAKALTHADIVNAIEAKTKAQRQAFRDKVAATHKHALIPATDKPGNMEESDTHRKLAFFKAMEAKNAKSSAPTQQLTVI